MQTRGEEAVLLEQGPDHTQLDPRASTALGCACAPRDLPVHSLADKAGQKPSHPEQLLPSLLQALLLLSDALRVWGGTGLYAGLQVPHRPLQLPDPMLISLAL